MVAAVDSTPVPASTRRPFARRRAARISESFSSSPRLAASPLDPRTRYPARSAAAYASRLPSNAARSSAPPARNGVTRGGTIPRRAGAGPLMSGGRGLARERGHDLVDQLDVVARERVAEIAPDLEDRPQAGLGPDRRDERAALREPDTRPLRLR